MYSDNRRDVTLICFSRAPIERLTAYKKRMGWECREMKEMIDNQPGWLRTGRAKSGPKLEDGLREQG
jgi:Bacterial protein of unknown function (DUF899)